MDRIEDWARENQQEAMAGVPRSENGKLQSGAFVLYGGTYEESNSSGGFGRRRMLAKFFECRLIKSTGNRRQDTSTERKLPKEIGFGIIEWTETAVATIAMRWNLDWAKRGGGLPAHPGLDVSAACTGSW